MNIIIVGCGKVGYTLVEQLSSENHNLVVIDERAEKVQNITNSLDAMGIVGNGINYKTLLEAGISTADLLIAVTGDDEKNLLCCVIAKKTGHCQTIARIRNPLYNEEIEFLKKEFGLAMIINPEYEVSKEISRILYLPSALEVNSFAHGQAELIKFKIPEGNILDGMTIMNLGQHIDTKVLICAIERDGAVFIPAGNFTMKAGDVISFVSSHKKVKPFLKNIGFKTNKVKDTMIIGGGKASYYLAKRLLAMGISVKIIECNKKRCEELSVLLPQAIIINGDGTDEDLLHEEGLEYIESFVPLTGIDEENILLTLHARQVSNAKVITKINRINFKNVISGLDLGSVVYPKYITSEAIIAYVRAKKDSMNSNIETLYHMFDHRVEAIEFRVDAKSNVTDIPFKDLKLKKNLLVSFINRNGNIIIPSGMDSIQLGDTVMIVTTHTGFHDIQDILAE